MQHSAPHAARVAAALSSMQSGCAAAEIPRGAPPPAGSCAAPDDEAPPWEVSLMGVLQGAPAKEFAVSGVLQDVRAFMPSIFVQTVGRLSLPITPAQVTELRVVASLAYESPGDYMRRMREVVAPSLRISSTGTSPTSWNATLISTAAAALQRMGVPAPPSFSLKLDSLVIVDPGSGVCDPFSARSSFATLIVRLPTVAGLAGGTLQLRLNGMERQVALACAAGRAHPDNFAFCAFLACASSSLSVVTSASPLVALRYTIDLDSLPAAGVARPLSVNTSSLAEALSAAAAAWARQLGGLLCDGEGCAAVRAQVLRGEFSACRLRLAWQLDGAYAAGFSFDALQGRDAAVVALLLGCRQLHVQLALVAEHTAGGSDGGESEGGGGMVVETVEWALPPMRAEQLRCGAASEFELGMFPLLPQQHMWPVETVDVINRAPRGSPRAGAADARAGGTRTRAVAFFWLREQDMLVCELAKLWGQRRAAAATEKSVSVMLTHAHLVEGGAGDDVPVVTYGPWPRRQHEGLLLGRINVD